MQNSKSDDYKEYYRQMGQGYLKSNEILEKCPKILQELQKTSELKQAHIDKLYDEIKQIKKLKV